MDGADDLCRIFSYTYEWELDRLYLGWDGVRVWGLAICFACVVHLPLFLFSKVSLGSILAWTRGHVGM